MRNAVVVFLATATLACAAGSGPGMVEVGRVLDDFHAAAAEADEERYFSHFAPGAVFLGTDDTERWSVEEFRSYAHTRFAEGRGWSYVVRDRHVSFSPDGRLAWFDERTENDTYGSTRGSGVLLLTPGGWKLAQYNLSVPVPNHLAAEVVALIRASPVSNGH